MPTLAQVERDAALEENQRLRDVLWKAVRFYDQVNRPHEEGEAKLLDEMAAAVAYNSQRSVPEKSFINCDPKKLICPAIQATEAEIERLRSLLGRCLSSVDGGKWRDRAGLSAEAHPVWDDVRETLRGADR